MYVNCCCKIRDKALEHILKNYIFRTPFLRVWEKDHKERESIENFFIEVDLIFTEMVYVSKERLQTLEPTLKTKPLLVLTDHTDIKDKDLPRNIIILHKALSHKEFVEGVSTLIERLGK